MSTQPTATGFKGHVLIIGGGIGGSALALFLKKAGITSTIFEAYPYKQAIGGGLGLAPNGMNVLASLGLVDQVLARSTPAYVNVFLNQQGNLIARFKNGSVEDYGQPGVCILRSTLYDILTEAVKKQNIDLQYEKKLKTITYRDAKVIAHFEDGTSAEGDLLVGADGVNSQTRRVTMPAAPMPEFVGIIGMGGVTPASAVPNMTRKEKEAFTFTYGATGFFGYGCGENSDLLWWTNIAREKELTRDEIVNVNVSDVQREVMAIFKGYHEPIETIINNTHSPIRQNISDIRTLPTWHKGRVVLLGDASHAVSPNSGQGASLALEDAMLLANRLHHSPDYETAFADYECERKPRVETIVAEGRRLGQDKKVVTPFQQAVREFMMKIFINLFGTRGQKWLFGYKVIWD